LVRLTSTEASTFSAAGGRNSLRFTANDGVTRLNHQTELWDAGTMTAAIWVRVPVVPGNAEEVLQQLYGPNWRVPDQGFAVASRLIRDEAYLVDSEPSGPPR
jgi:hypothetical protein